MGYSTLMATTLNDSSSDFLNRKLSEYVESGLIKLSLSQVLSSHVKLDYLDGNRKSSISKNSEQLFREYEVEKWSSELARIKRIASSESMLLDEIFTPVSKETCVRIFDSLYETDSLTARRFFIDCLALLVSEIVSDVSCVVDIGSGTGATLLPLLARIDHKEVPIFATDISPSGLSALSHISKIRGMNIETFVHDFVNGFELNRSIPTEGLYITSFSLSCLPFIPQTFFEDLLALDPSYILHIEAVYEKLNTEKDYDNYSQRYIEWNDYNRNLFSGVESAIDMYPGYEMKYISPTFFGQNPLFPLTIILWGKAKRDIRNTAEGYGVVD